MQDENEALAARVAGLERAVADLSRRLDESLFSGSENSKPAPPGLSSRQSAPKAPAAGRAASRSASPPKSAEWWLARGGALLTVFALILLYQYAVDRNWITPLLRILLGTATGVVLMVPANRTSRAPELREDAVGLREILMGAALAAWYITAYAASVFYNLVSLSTARLLFLALSIVGAALGLREKRALLAFFSLAVGFSVPMLLSSPIPSIPPFTIYLTALTALGLVLYLMRGWQSVLWLTFLGFWWSVGSASGMACCSAIPGVATDTARISLTILIAIAAAAMARVPVLRRKLLATGSDLYAETRHDHGKRSILGEIGEELGRHTRHESAVDSPALWFITLSAPVLATVLLSVTWPFELGMLWGTILLGVAAISYFIVSKTEIADEIMHVRITGVAVWSLAGVLWIATGMASLLNISVGATQLLAASGHAVVVLRLMRDNAFVMPARLARLTALVLGIAVLMLEAGTHALQAYLTLAELVAIATAMWSVWLYRDSKNERFVALVAVIAYIALLTVDARFLGQIFRPLVTASYALIGTVLLVAGKNIADRTWIRRLGGLTLILVVGRLLVVDLAGVETIWRVVLFLGIGALFLFTSYRLQRDTKISPANAEPAA